LTAALIGAVIGANAGVVFDATLETGAVGIFAAMSVWPANRKVTDWYGCRRLFARHGEGRKASGSAFDAGRDANNVMTGNQTQLAMNKLNFVERCAASAPPLF